MSLEQIDEYNNIHLQYQLIGINHFRIFHIGKQITEIIGCRKIDYVVGMEFYFN